MFSHSALFGVLIVVVMVAAICVQLYCSSKKDKDDSNDLHVSWDSSRKSSSILVLNPQGPVIAHPQHDFKL